MMPFGNVSGVVIGLVGTGVVLLTCAVSFLAIVFSVYQHTHLTRRQYEERQEIQSIATQLRQAMQA